LLRKNSVLNHRRRQEKAQRQKLSIGESSNSSQILPFDRKFDRTRKTTPEKVRADDALCIFNDLGPGITNGAHGSGFASTLLAFEEWLVERLSSP
jgi:hypothetical protein